MKQVTKPIHAYFLGWMYSDGCIYSIPTKSVYQTRIKLQSGDSERIVLNLFKNEFSFREFQEVHKNGKTYIGIYLSGREFYEGMTNLGVLPRKSTENKENLSIPDMEDRFFGYFLRGLLEGDGTFYLRGKTGDRVILFCSSQKFLEEIQKRLEILGIDSTITFRKNSSIICLNINKLESLKKLLNLVYSDELHMVLERKYSKVQKFLDFYEKYADREDNRKRRISLANFGKRRTEEVKKKLSEAHLGKKLSPKVREEIKRKRRTQSKKIQVLKNGIEIGVYNNPLEIQEFSLQGEFKEHVASVNKKGRNGYPYYFLKASNIYTCCYGKTKEYKGLVFKYLDQSQ